MDEKVKTRGLLVLRADRYFDESHLHFETVRAYKALLEETHVLVFSKSRVPKEKQFAQPEPKVFIYQYSTRFSALHFWKIWKFLVFNLYWRKSFRTDFILSFTAGKGGFLAYLLSKRYKRPFFLVSRFKSILGSKWSLKRMIARKLFHKATIIFIPGSQNAINISKILGIPPANLRPVHLPVDLATIEHSGATYDYQSQHPQYNFYISCCADTIDELRALMLVYSHVAAKYPRVGLVVIADREAVARLEKFIKRTKAYGVFVYPEDDGLLAKIAGSHVYLAVSNLDEVDTKLLYALGLEVPVVAYRYGIARELFPGTPFERFICDAGDTEAAAKLIIELIEHQVTRNEYAINTGLIFKKFNHQSTAEYIQSIHETIETIIHPPKEGVSAAPMYLKNVLGEGGKPDESK